MIRDRTLRARKKLVERLPVTGELLRGSLLERVVRHKRGCPKCTRGEGHRVYVLTVSYAGGRTRQISVRREVARTPVTSKTAEFGLEDGGVCSASVRPHPASRVSTAREIVGGLDGLGGFRWIPGETRASSLPPRRVAGGANVGSIILAQGFEEEEEEAISRG
jgi:hypothetical protein